MLRHRSLWLVCIALLSLPLSLRAQTTTGTVRGYVKELGVSLDVFNVFNYANYGCFNTFKPTDPNFGKASCTISDPRHAQIGAEYRF